VTRLRLVLRTLAVAGILCGLGGLAACGSAGPAPKPTPSAPPPTASAVPRPAANGCAQLTYDQAVAPTLPASDPSAPCSAGHTSETFAVGGLATLVSGHLLAVDSDRVNRQVARTCPARLAAYVGGDAEKLRLSMLRAVWFTPTVAQAEAGADWYRCDVIALAGDRQLATVTGSLKGVLDSPKAGDWSMCATAQPGTAGFARVPCRSAHTWRALQTVALPSGPYPGEAAVKAAGQQPCQSAGRDVAKDALNYQWGYEWPTAEQWTAGQTYGICWAPDAG